VTRRKREAVTLQSALDWLLKILDVENMPRSEHLSLVARAMEARLGISFEAVAEKLEDFGESRCSAGFGQICFRTRVRRTDLDSPFRLPNI
jgi:hypothetical protein